MRISDWSSDVCSSDLTKPSCSIAFSTAARVLSVRNSDRLITRLTVFFETPASAATSLIVGCLPPGPLFCAAIFALSPAGPLARRSEEHTSELQSLMRISYAVFCLKKKTKKSYTQLLHQGQQKLKFRCTYNALSLTKRSN